MTMTGLSNEEIFDAYDSALDALLKSSTASDFCRAVVHSDMVPAAHVQGCQLWLLDNSGHLSVLAGYGLPYLTEDVAISAWGNSPLSEAIRNKVAEFEEGSAEQPAVIAVPLLRDAVPVGCLTLSLSQVVTSPPMHYRILQLLSKLGTYCLLSMAHPQAKNIGREPNGEDLTSRQIQILDFIADGLVNAEIAAKLMLSESTIRQETVRIYRSLGVPNRAEAAKKGRAIGLIQGPPFRP